MGGFVLAAAVLVAVTLLLLLRPWRRAPAADVASSPEVNAGVYRDQLQELDRDLAAGTLSAEDHAQARAELQRRLLDDAGNGDTQAATPFGMRYTALALVLLMPLGAAGLYAVLGTPAALDPVATREPTRQDVEKMVSDLAARMEKNPGDAKGWIVLARSYRAMNRLPEAENAFNKIGDTLYQNATLLAEYGDVLATRAMGNFDGKPMEIVQRALKLEPENPMALSLAATASYNRNDFTQAVAYWEQLLKIVPPGSEDANWLTQAIAKTREQMAGPGASPQVAAASTQKPPAAAAAGAAVSGRVSLAPALAAQVQPGDTVFIFARNPQGSRMPLAVQRIKVSDLPFDFKLDDSTAMNPEFKLSSAAEVRIEARISKSGSATPGPGDLIGVGPVVKPGANQVAVQIDQVRP
ncbi:MAG: c-type cytochrome biogenesis protein CcmI [Rhizobacter sp.]|nr:c-type cytochrome biogenesis protein CcmI [Rhizobacter sp.]